MDTNPSNTTVSESQDVESDFIIIQHTDIPTAEALASSPQPDEVLARIYAWLQPTQYEETDSELQKHLSSYLKGTGKWLFESPVYRQWHQSQQDSILWIRGIPGSGKSVIASHLVNQLRPENCPVLFFFFRHTIDTNHHPEAALRDFLAQILVHSPLLQKECIRLIDNQGSRLDTVSIDAFNLEELCRLVRLGLSNVQAAYCILDALDEMDQSKLETFLRCLNELGSWRPASVKLILTSRPISVVENVMRNMKVLDVRVDKGNTEPDISSYLHHRLKTSNMPQDMIPSVVDQILKKTDGLFLYAKLAVDAVVNLPPGHDIESSLRAMPYDLNTLYTSLLSDHTRRTGISESLQSLVFECVTTAVRPLRVLELSDLIFVTQPQYAKNRGDMKRLIRLVCGPLIEVLPDESVRVIHHSFTEYFFSLHNVRHAVGDAMAIEHNLRHGHMALFCIEYLKSALQNIIQSNTSEGLTAATIENPFLKYAIDYWHIHIQKAAALNENQEQVNNALEKLFSTSEMLCHIVTLAQLRHLSSFTHFEEPQVLQTYATTDLPATILRLAMWLKLRSFAKFILRHGSSDLVQYNCKLKFSPLITAVREGDEDMACLLIQLGADLDDCDSNGLTPLHATVNFRDNAIPRPSLAGILINAGADVWKERGLNQVSYCDPANRGPSIELAFQHGDEALLSAFLPCIKNEKSAGQALIWAIMSYSQTPENIRFILKHPHFDVNSFSWWDTPIVIASSMRDPDRIDALLKEGANPKIIRDNTASSGFGINALHALAYHKPFHCPHGKVGGEKLRRCFELVLAAGANIEQKDWSGRTPLHVVDDPVAAKCLLDAGANTYAMNMKGNTILHDCENEEILKLVVERADINARSAGGMTCLMSWLRNRQSWKEFNENIPMILISNGVDVTLSDNEGNTALHYAIRVGHKGGSCVRSVVEAIIRRGADVNFKNPSGETPLHWLKYSSCCSSNILTMMIKAGADLEAKDSKGRTPLMAFASLDLVDKPEASELFDIMAEAGADFTTTDALGCTLLHAAALRWDEESWFIQYLADHGVDMKQADHEGNSVWHTIVHERFDEFPYRTLYLQLIRLGTDPCAHNAAGQTPLHQICMYQTCVFEMDRQYTDHELCQSVFDYLLSVYKDVDCKDNNGITPLHSASTYSTLLTTRLLQKGADPSRATNEGLTAFHLAARSRNPNILGLLLDALRKKHSPEACVSVVNKKDDMGRTSLYYACRSGRVESVRILLDAGATMDNASFQGSAWQGCADFEHELSDAFWTRHVVRLWGNNPKYRAIFPNIQGESEPASSYDVNPVFAGPCRLTSSGRPVQIIQVERVFDEDRYLPYGPPLGKIVWKAPSERLDDIVSLLIERQSVPSNDLIKDAISSAANDGFGYTVEVLSRLTQCLKLDGDFACRPELKTCIAKRQDLRNSLSENPISFRRRMEFRDFEIVVESLDQIEDGKLHAPQDVSDSIIHQLIKGGYAWLLDRIVSPEIVSSLDRAMDAAIDTEELQYETSTPLIIAACRREEPNMEVLRILVENGANVNAQTMIMIDSASTPDKSALHILVEGNNWWQARRAISYLVRAGADMELKDAHGRTPLRMAIEATGTPQFNLAAVEELLALGADPNSVDKDEVSCLSRAVLDCKETFNLLLQQGAVISCNDLLEMIWSMNTDLLRLLLSSGGDPNICNYKMAGPDSETLDLTAKQYSGDDFDDSSDLYPLDGVVYCHNSKGDKLKSCLHMFKILLEFNANPEAKYGQTTIMHRMLRAQRMASNDEDVEPMPLLPFFELIFSHRKVDMEARDNKGCTILHHSCQNWHEIVPLLLDNGASVHARDAAGRLPIHIYAGALNQSCDDLDSLGCLARLLASPEMLDDMGSQGMSPLHLALDGRNLDIAEALVAAGANLYPTATSIGDSPLHLLFKGTWAVDEEGVVSGKLKTLCDLFLARGAHVNGRNNDDETPIFNFFRYGSITSKESPKLGEGHPRFRELEDLTEERKAAALAGIAAVEAEALVWAFLDEIHVDWTVRNSHGQSLLHIVASDQTVESDGENECVGRRVARFQFLLSKGLDERAEDNQHHTPLDVAAAVDNQDLLELFSKRED